jgi:hypothetical protein
MQTRVIGKVLLNAYGRIAREISKSKDKAKGGEEESNGDDGDGGSAHPAASGGGMFSK